MINLYQILFCKGEPNRWALLYDSQQRGHYSRVVFPSGSQSHDVRDTHALLVFHGFDPHAQVQVAALAGNWAVKPALQNDRKRSEKTVSDSRRQ